MRVISIRKAGELVTTVLWDTSIIKGVVVIDG